MVRILTQEEAAKDGLEEAGERTETGVDGETAQDSDGRIRYREKNGSFSSVEEIKQVEGIKEGVYNRIKDHIKVK